MKKFLTVLLVIAVMFTFSFSSAFALPSDTTEVEYAGVADAQKYAYDVINNYAKLSDYTAEGQGIILLKQSDFTKAVKKAKTIAAVKKAADGYKDFIDGLDDYLRANVTLKEAADKAVAQAKDYRLGKGSLYDILVIKGNVYEETTATGYKLACAKMDAAYAEFEAVIENARKNVGTVEGIEVALDKLASAANAVGREFFAEAPDAALQDAIDWLVKEIEAYSGKVTTKKHSTKVFNQYEALLAEGVAAAKAVKTWDEFGDVYDKYLGGEACAWNEGNGNDVVIYRETVNPFDALIAMDKEREAEMAVAQKVLDEIGAYDYKAVWIYVWEAAKAEYDKLEDLADGIFDPSKEEENDPSIAAYIVDEIGTGSTKAEIKEVVEDAVEWYESYLTLASVKYYLTVDGGIIDSMVASFGEEYPVNNQTEIENLGKLAKTEVKVAADLDAIVDILIEYYLEMEAVPTSKEIADAEAVEAYNKDMDEKIADLIDAAKEADSKFAISADEQILLNKMVQIYKDNNAAEEDPASTVASADVDDFKYLIQNLKWTGTVPAWLAAAVEPSFSTGAYAPKTQHYIEIAKIDFLAAKDAAKSWADYFAAIEVAEKTLAGFQTLAEANLETAIADMIKAIDALPDVKTKDDLKAYDKAEAKAETAFEDLEDAVKDMLAELGSDYDAIKALLLEKKDTVVDNALKFYNKKFEAEYVRYLANLEAQGQSVSNVAEEFYAIAEDMTGLLSCYDATAQKEISTIITDTYKALRATKEIAEMDKIAEAAIQALDAVKEKAADNSEYIEILENGKAEAAKYFNKYYGVTFTSEATTHLQLAYDIMDLQEELATVEARNEAKIAAVESLKLKASSTKGKGWIRVQWKVTGDAAAADGYQLYKSTKAQSGYKKCITTKKTSFKNTKNLKKGVRYFYKVRAYVVVEGTTYYSDWSNKANRVAL